MLPGMARVPEDAAGPGGDETSAAADAIRRWVALGRDVVVRGDDGSGRTRALERVLADASRRGTPAVLVRAGGPSPLAALRGQASVLADRLPADPAALTAWLVDELRGRRAVLLVDDLDEVDAASAEVLAQALRLTSAAFVATTSADLAREVSPVVARLVADRAPAEVRLPPLGFQGVARLLARVLRGPADVALTSSVTARSGGNPRVVVALADAARHAGVVRQVQGRWHKVGSLDDVPVDAVAYAMLARLGPAEAEALEMLAWTGPVPLPVAESVLDPAVLTGLVDRGRLRTYRTPGAPDTVSVFPPALAAALRSRLTEDRRRRLTERVAAEVGPQATPFSDGAPPAADRLLRGDESTRRWTADLAGLLQERGSAEESARRTRWQTDPTVAHAVRYLAVLLRRRADAQVAAVLAGTERSAEDDPDDLAQLALDEIRWAGWRGEGPEAIGRRMRATGVAGAPGLVLQDARLGAAREAAAATTAAGAGSGAGDDPVPEAAGPHPPPGTPPLLRRWFAVARASGFLDAGRPDLALAACEADDGAAPREADVPDDGRPGRDPAGPPAAGYGSDVDHHRDGVRGEALLALGRIDEAARHAGRLLDRAFDDLDLVGIRVHSCVLAEALLLGGDADAAWGVVGASLRLGPGGPLDNAFYRRTLSVGAEILARRGSTDVAEVLLDELAATPSGVRPAVYALGAVGHAALAAARGERPDAEPLWDRGCRYADEGLVAPALTCWLVRPAVYDAERLAVVRSAAGACRLPLLEPNLRLHEAWAAGDQDGVVAAVPEVRLDPAGLVAAAVATLDRERAARVEPTAGRPEPDATEPRREALSAREREVAAMVGGGMTNREIAERLYLSVRTVENHVSNVLHKLGVDRRAELARWFPADDGRPSPRTQSVRASGQVPPSARRRGTT